MLVCYKGEKVWDKASGFHLKACLELASLRSNVIKRNDNEIIAVFSKASLGATKTFSIEILFPKRWW